MHHQLTDPLNILLRLRGHTDAIETIVFLFALLLLDYGFPQLFIEVFKEKLEPTAVSLIF